MNRFFVICIFVFIRGCTTQNTRYNETEARQMMHLSAGAYGTQKESEDCMNRVFPGYTDTILLSTKEDCDTLNNPCEAYIATDYDTQQLFIVFRGTKTNTQLLLEGWSTLAPTVDFYGMGQVNRYFKNGHELLWDSVLLALQDPRFMGFTVYFTGHSLGGALAALAAARAANEGLRTNDKIKVITFGEPRVGNVDFAFAFDRLISFSFRVVFRMDIVPHSPSCIKDQTDITKTLKDSLPCFPNDPTGQYHHGTEIWYPESMTPGSRYIECTGQPKNEDFTCSDQFKFNVKKYQDYIWDHRHYFSVRVPEFGKTGCDPAFPEGFNSQ